MNAPVFSLSDATVGPMDWLDDCHQRIGVALGELRALVQRVESEGVDEQARQMARSVHDFFSSTARNHHLDEERHVFPRLLQSTDAELVQATLRLSQDHGWLEQDWLELSPVLQSIADGNQGVDVDYLREAVSVFNELYHDHLTLEESLIYPAARRRMDEADMATMGREMAERRAQARAAG